MNEQDFLESISRVLIATAKGDFEVRAPRTYTGDRWDVLTYLVNETSEEVRRLVEQLHEERAQLIAARDRLHEAEKLAALGELAGGVAHELNQPLTVIQALSELLLEHPESSVGQRKNEIAMMGAAARRMGRIVSAIRTFGRNVPLRKERFGLAEPLRATLELLQTTLDAEGVIVRTGISENMPPFSGDPDALQQVFINLVSNARDAMALNSEGQERVLQIDMHMHKDRARVIFSDTGPGVPPSIASKLFDPFFTTKDVGRGTGLGLSISHGIVQKHRGMLRYEAPAGGGARFVVELPFPDDDVPPAEVTS